MAEEVRMGQRRGSRRFVFGEGTEECAFEVDLLLAFNKITAINREYDDGVGGEVPHYLTLIRELGGPDVSTEEALEFVNWITEYGENLKKKAAPSTSTPPSASSTDSPPSDSIPTTS